MPSAAALDLVRPTFESLPVSASSELGQEAVELAASAGLLLDPWQAYTLERLLAEKADGRPAAFEVGLIVPRQNGKGSVLEALSLAWLFLTDAPLVLHSAHEFKTAAEAFRRLRALIQGAPHLWRRVEKVTTAAGNEAIELASGQRLRYVARSKGSGRGFTGGKLILDEAYAIEAEEMAALLPTLATQPEAQLVYTSSAGMANSSHLRAVRDRGRAGGDPSLCYLEWGGVARCPTDCAHALDDGACALNDFGLRRAANPGAPLRIPDEFMQNERRALGPAEYGRERLGIWDEPVGGDSLPVGSWLACADPSGVAAKRPVFAVDVSPGSRSAAIVVAAKRADGLPQVEVVEHGPRTEWVIARCVQLLRNDPMGWVVDPEGPAGALIPALAEAGIEPHQMSARDRGQSCEALAVAVADKAVRHLGDPILTRAVVGAGRRDIGDGLWAWSRKRSDADICPLVAATEALWLLSKEPPAYDLLDSFY